MKIQKVTVVTPQHTLIKEIHLDTAKDRMTMIIRYTNIPDQVFFLKRK